MSQFIEMTEAALAALMRRGCRENGFDARLQIIEGDVRQIGSDRVAPVDLVVSNPPYFPAAGAEPVLRQAPKLQKKCTKSFLKTKRPGLRLPGMTRMPSGSR